jgi:hypothetical protein
MGVGKTAVGEYIRRAEVIGIRGQCRMGSTTPRPSGLHLGHS